MIDRIQRVINNHQLSCEHTSKYFYILRGFTPFIDKVRIPVEKRVEGMDEKMNRYILEEELADITADNYKGFDVWTVTFNFFDGKILNKKGDLIEIEELNLPVRFKNLNIFNDLNPLVGITEDLNLNNDERIDYLKKTNIL